MGGARRVVVVTGGGGGIGAAIAEELGREGAFVVTMDPLVSLDGTEQLAAPEETTADSIVAAGGSARAASVSVTDRAGVDGLFTDLVEEFGRLDAVVNVAGISRPTSFTGGGEEDWLAVLSVHLEGYLNVLDAALPIMAAAGRGHILGVTSGSGWRPADAGAYGCAKRAVAALTWQLGRVAPPGVVVNAMSPIAVTRMVTAALARVRPDGGPGAGSSATGGFSLGSMPSPVELGPFAAHLVSEGFGWCRGQVLFTGGSEVAVLDEPRLLEVLRADDRASLPYLLERATSGVLIPAEGNQASTGGANPRIGSGFDAPAGGDLPPAAASSCVLVTDRPELAAAVVPALEARSVTCHTLPTDGGRTSFGDAAAALSSAFERVGPRDVAVVVALAAVPPTTGAPAEWERVLAEHAGLVEHIHTDVSWCRAAVDNARAEDRALRLVTLSDATTAGGRSRAQASAQLSRAARGATDDRVVAFAISIETPDAGDLPAVGELVAHLVCSPDAVALSGAELVAAAGWIGLRSHPRPSGSVTFGGPALPAWLDATLQSIVR